MPEMVANALAPAAPAEEALRRSLREATASWLASGPFAATTRTTAEVAAAADPAVVPPGSHGWVAFGTRDAPKGSAVDNRVYHWKLCQESIALFAPTVVGKDTLGCRFVCFDADRKLLISDVFVLTADDFPFWAEVKDHAAHLERPFPAWLAQRYLEMHPRETNLKTISTAVVSCAWRLAHGTQHTHGSIAAAHHDDASGETITCASVTAFGFTLAVVNEDRTLRLAGMHRVGAKALVTADAEREERERADDARFAAPHPRLDKASLLEAARKRLAPKDRCIMTEGCMNGFRHRGGCSRMWQGCLKDRTCTAPHTPGSLGVYLCHIPTKVMQRRTSAASLLQAAVRACYRLTHPTPGGRLHRRLQPPPAPTCEPCEDEDEVPAGGRKRSRARLARGS